MDIFVHNHPCDNPAFGRSTVFLNPNCWPRFFIWEAFDGAIFPVAFHLWPLLSTKKACKDHWTPMERNRSNHKVYLSRLRTIFAIPAALMFWGICLGMVNDIKIRSDFLTRNILFEICILYLKTQNKKELQVRQKICSALISLSAIN